MLSRSRTGLVPLKEVAIDIGIHVSAYRLLKVGSLRSPQANTNKIHTACRRPLICAKRSQVLRPHRAGIIHWWHPKTPKTEEILDELHNTPAKGKLKEERARHPAKILNALPDEIEDSSKVSTYPASIPSSPPERELPYTPWKEPFLKVGPQGMSKPMKLDRDLLAHPKLNKSENVARRIDASALTESFRRTMRTLPSPIVVLTAAYYGETLADHIYRGMTVSSFSSLSISPEPLITFNIKSETGPNVRASRGLQILQNTGHFLIHIIDGSPDGARLANFFATVHENQFTAEAQEKAGFEIEVVEDFCHTAETRFILPRLVGKGISRVLRCEIMTDGISVPGYDILEPNKVTGEMDSMNKVDWDSDKRSIRRGFIRVGDHVLCIAKVLDVLENDRTVPNSKLSGLGYQDGKYRVAGKVIEVPNLQNDCA